MRLMALVAALFGVYNLIAGVSTAEADCISAAECAKQAVEVAVRLDAANRALQNRIATLEAVVAQLDANKITAPAFILSVSKACPNGWTYITTTLLAVYPADEAKMATILPKAIVSSSVSSWPWFHWTICSKN